MPKTIELSAWIGSEDTLLDVKPTLPAEAEFFSYRGDCDTAHITACDHGHKHILNGQTITDTALQLLSEDYAHYIFKYHGYGQGPMVRYDSPQDGVAFSARDHHSVVAYNDKLWLIGGAGQEARLNDVWSSTDGLTWTQETEHAAFSPRTGAQVVVFNNQLWLIGGQDDQGYKNDIWSSSDGKTWAQVTEKAAFSPRSGHRVAVFNNQLWLTGCAGTQCNGDVWSSADGTNWTKAVDIIGPQYSRFDHQMVVFANKLWVIGGYVKLDQVYTLQREVWSSADGKEWTPVVTKGDISSINSRYQRVAAWNNQLWLISGVPSNTAHQQIWSSNDGKTWTKVTDTLPLSTRSGHQVVVYDNQLWLIGGTPYGADKTNDIWKTADGKNWRLGWKYAFTWRASDHR